MVLDGVDLRAVARGGVAGAAAVVPQQTFLFDDTVRGNVTLGLDVPDSEVRRALVVAQADRFVDALPDGLDTRIGERGMTLSGGQRQRLALARAIVRSPRLLVMDDATSSVDARVEAAILAGLRSTGGAEGAPTVVVVAYRKATIALADEVVYVEHGRVVDRGTHLELQARCPGYRSLITAYEREDAERAALAADEEASEPVGLTVGGSSGARCRRGPRGSAQGLPGHADHPAPACGHAPGCVRPVRLCSPAMRAPTGTLLRAGLTIILGLAVMSCTDEPEPGTIKYAEPHAVVVVGLADAQHPRGADRGCRPRLLRRAHPSRADE